MFLTPKEICVQENIIGEIKWKWNIFLIFSSYRLRIESMLLKAEFESNMSFLEPTIDAMLASGESKRRILVKLQPPAA